MPIDDEMMIGTPPECHVHSSWLLAIEKNGQRARFIANNQLSARQTPV